MKEIKWNYHSPKFECDTYNLEMMKYSPWSGHRLFAYDYICSMKPDQHSGTWKLLWMFCIFLPAGIER